MQLATGVSCSRLATCTNRDGYVKSVMKTIHAEGAANKLALCFKFRNFVMNSHTHGDRVHMDPGQGSECSGSAS